MPFQVGDAIEAGTVFLMNDGELLFVHHRHGSTIGVTNSSGYQSGWSHPPCAERFLRFYGAQTIGSTSKVPTSREEIVLAMAKVVAVAALANPYSSYHE